MKRTAILIDQSLHGTTLLYVDVQNAQEIFSYIFRELSIEKEFREIRTILKENLRNAEKYKKANVSSKAENIFEMRFIQNQRNDRIYCQELNNGRKRFIILIELFEGKKSQGIPKKIKSRIEKIGGYQYEL
ncbi:MAG: hypothetical protein NTX61_01150 [Bacteroidetes bacterium]|nr:hypothetical protein [Bacteroidota bacterium]